MKKGVIVLFLLIVFLLPFISSGSVDSEMKKITHYAEEYETGNIDYVKLRLYLSSSREGLNEILGAKSKNLGGIIKQDKLNEVLGEPNEMTKWVWVEGENHDAKLDNAIPIWKKIVFDGKKIQIRMEAFPSIFKSNNEFDKKFEGMPEEVSIIYRLNFQTEFKKPQEQLDIQGKINKIQELAKTGVDLEILAKESVNAEMIFRDYFKQGSGKCEDLMSSIFGSENKRQTQQILLNEIVFCEGEKFEGIMRLEMCDDCEWNYISLDFRLEGRGPGFNKNTEGIENDRNIKDRYKIMDAGSLMEETKKLTESMQSACQEENFDSLFSYSNELRTITEAWNEKANDIWEQIEKEKPKEQPEGNNDPYWWIKQDQAQRQKASELRKQNYEIRKTFYQNLFSAYSKQEFYFEQTNFEKRLIEEFREKGEEICNNNIDDNDNEQVDCDDSQCGGKICGKGTIVEGNETKEINYYCISGTCQAKEEINETRGPICGNHICEQDEEICLSSVVDCNENGSECASTADCGKTYCSGDCVECPIYDAIECSGRVEFSGEDEKGCPLPPICIEETESCEVDEDCPQPTCGVTKCIIEDEKSICKIAELTLCGGNECEDGGKQIKECDNQKIVSSVCMGGMWIDTNAGCSEGESCDDYCRDYISTMMPECPGDLKISGTSPNCSCEWACDEIVNNECVVASDCGGEKDVCSNGRCETIPEKISIKELEEEVVEEPEVEEPEFQEPEEQEEVVEESVPESEPESQEAPEQNEPESSPEPEQNEPEESSNEETPITGEIIFGFFRALVNKIGITGYAVDEGGDVSSEPEPESSPEPEHFSEPDFDGIDRVDDGNNFEPESEPDNDCADKWQACGGSCPPCDYDQGLGDEGNGNFNDGEWNDREHKDDSGEWEKRDNEERERNEKENRERCQNECSRPCVEKCIREICGEAMDCEIDKESKSCESSCSSEDSCVENCMSGNEDWWKEFENEDMHKEEKGVFQVGGGCRKEQGRTEGYIWFGGWGEPYGELENLKQKYYERGEGDWCKYELENLIKQRKEVEKGFNQEFAQWFFEKYLPNSAEEWEQAQSGIFELYWHNVDNQMRLAHTMQCLDKNDITKLMDVNLINIEYETEYGKLEYWEELKIVNMPEVDGSVTIVSPYMKVWIFPSKKFIKYEMQKSMENHELPGSPEEKMERENQEGLTEEQKQEIKNDDKAMERIRKTAEEYGGSLDMVIQFKDYETNEVVFNLFAQINERDIMKIEPMLPSEVGEKDATIEMDFALFYEMIFVSEKDMMGSHIESPPWDKKMKPIQKIKEIGNGVKMWNKMRKLKNSAIITPEGDNDIEEIAGWIMENVMGGPGGGRESQEENKENKEEDSSNFENKMGGKVVWLE